MATSLEEIAYAESLRSLEDQERALASVRTSAGILLAAASVATSATYFQGINALRVPPSIEDVHRQLSLHLEQAALSNQRKLDHLFSVFRYAAIGLILEILVWAMAAGGL